MTSVLDRLVAAGITEARARWWIESGAVSIDGKPTTDPTIPAACPSRVVLRPPPQTDTVNLALRHLDGQPMTRDDALAMHGVRAIEEIARDDTPT